MVITTRLDTSPVFVVEGVISQPICSAQYQRLRTGATDSRQLYREAWLMQAVQQIQSKNYKTALTSVSTAQLWPENLGAGKPYESDIDVRLETYMIGICYEKLKNDPLAAKQWNNIAEYKGNTANVNDLVTAMALTKANRAGDGKKVLVDWLQNEPSNAMARWCMDAYQGSPSSGEIEGDENYRVLKALLMLR